MTPHAVDPIPDAAVLDAFELASAPLERAVSGLINPTWYVRSPARSSCCSG